MPINKKSAIIAMAMFASIGLTACTEGEDTYILDSKGDSSVGVLEEGKKLSKQSCDTTNAGSMLFVKDSSSTFLCDGENWISLKGIDGKDGETTSKVDTINILVRDTVFSRDTIVLSKKDTIVVRDTVRGLDGQTCSAAKVSKGKQTGFELSCGGAVIDTIWNGEKGDPGESSCSAAKISKDGLEGIEISCGGIVADTLWNGADGKNGVGCLAIDTVDANGRTGYNVECSEGRVGTLWNGIDGKNGVGCSAVDTTDEYGVIGYNMTCGGERVGTVWNGVDGLNGTSCYAQDTVDEEGVFGINIICDDFYTGTLWSGVDGKDGETCYVKKLESGYEIDCGSSNIIDLYNGFCGTTPYDPTGEKFCYGVQLYDKCNGQAYDVTKNFCYNKTSVEAFCGGKEYNLSTQFCYNNTKAYAKCNGKSYNPSVSTCSNNKISQTISFSAKAEGLSMTTSKTVTIPAGVSSVTMKLTNPTYGDFMKSLVISVSIGGVSQNITFTSALGSTEGSVSPTSKTFTFTALTKNQNVSIKTVSGDGYMNSTVAGGNLTFTYTP